MEQSDPEGLSIIDILLERIEYLEEVVSNLIEHQQELEVEHTALYYVMRATGKFSQDAFNKMKFTLIKQRREQEELENGICESEPDEEPSEGDDR
jgi:hypothetical protein